MQKSFLGEPSVFPQKTLHFSFRKVHLRNYNIPRISNTALPMLAFSFVILVKICRETNFVILGAGSTVQIAEPKGHSLSRTGKILDKGD